MTVSIGNCAYLWALPSGGIVPVITSQAFLVIICVSTLMFSWGRECVFEANVPAVPAFLFFSSLCGLLLQHLRNWRICSGGTPTATWHSVSGTRQELLQHLYWVFCLKTKQPSPIYVVSISNAWHHFFPWQSHFCWSVLCAGVSVAPVVGMFFASQGWMLRQRD